MRMIRKRVNPHRELRAGYMFAMDMITWSHRSEEGNKYSMVLRCTACHVFEVLNLYLKSDATNAFESWLVETRANPLFADLPYPMCFMLKTDNDGAWNEDNREWQAMIKKYHVNMYYVAPDRHAEANGFAEKARGIIEVVTKSFLAQRSLPPSWWQRCANSAKFVLNRFPVTSAEVAFSLDGDYVRPLEILTRFWYSRQQINRELSYFIGPGELCIVHDSDVSGSSLQPKVRWGISLGTMHYETPWFECPFSKAHYKSKSYSAYRMRSEVDCWSFLNLPRPNPSRKSMHLPIDNDVVATATLKEFKSFHVSDPKLMVDCRKPVKAQIDHTNTPADPNPTSVKQATSKGDKGLGGSAEPSQLERVNEKGGSVIIKDDEGRLLMTDTETGSIYYEDTQDIKMEQLMKQMDSDINEQGTVDTDTVDMPDASVEMKDMPKAVMSDSQTVIDNRHRHRASKRQKDQKLDQNKRAKTSIKSKKIVKIGDQKVEVEKSKKIEPKGQSRRIENIDDWNMGDVFIDVLDDIMISPELDKLESEQEVAKTVEIGNMQTLKNVAIKKLGLTNDLVKPYQQWLIEVHGFRPDEIPVEGKDYAKPGLKCVYPTGLRWREMINEKYDRKLKHARMRAEQALIEMCMYDTVDLVRAFTSEVRAVKDIIRANNRKQQRRDKAVGMGQEAPPKSLTDAFNHPVRAVEWWNAALEEFEGLTDMGVFDHDYTRAMLDELGIHTIIPLSVCLDHKYDADGMLNRLKVKVRMALAGHKGNLRKGEHFFHTFAATPNSNSMRLMQALLVYHKWSRKSFDVKQAYCFADIPKDELIAVRYPKGFERWVEEYNHKTDTYEWKECFMVIRKSLYGHPAAGRRWAETIGIHSSYLILMKCMIIGCGHVEGCLVSPACFT